MNSERTIALIGENAYARLQTAQVIIFGVGGVGGWCAEALVRSGIQHLTLIDYDLVTDSNSNRQVVALSTNIGLPKVAEMKARLLAINPEAQIETRHERYSGATLPEGKGRYLIDAIDEITPKALLLHEATNAGYTVFSSMGAGRRITTEAIHTGEFRKVSGCPLARALRHKMKDLQCWPEGKVQCVWSDGEIVAEKGTLAPVVGVFGFKLAELVLTTILDTTIH
mgnify:FL=1